MRENIIEKSNKILNTLLILNSFLLPLFFLPVTRDWFEFNRQVLFISVALVGLLLWGIKTAAKEEMRIIRTSFTVPLLIFGIAVLVSAVAAPARIVSFVSLNTWVLILMPVIYFLYLHGVENKKQILYNIYAFLISGTLISIGALYNQGLLIGLWDNFLNLPNENLNLAGSMINMNGIQIAVVTLTASLAVFLKKKVSRVTFAVVGIISLVALAVMNPFTAVNKPLLLDFGTSWHVAVESMKNSPLFGSGPGKYVESFQRFKPVQFNSTETWNVNFGSASNSPLQLLTETGMIGFIAFLSVFGAALYSLKGFIQNAGGTIPLLNKDDTDDTDEGKGEEDEEFKKAFLESALSKSLGLGLLASALYLFLFPLTTTTFFTFILLAALFEKQRFLLKSQPGQEVQIWVLALPVKDGDSSSEIATETEDGESVNRAGLTSAVLIVIIILNLVGFYGLARTYGAEYKFTQSLEAARENNGNETYRLQQEAIRLNPWKAQYHVAYSGTNLGLANSLADRIGDSEGEESDNGRRNVSVLINQAIREGRVATNLAPNNASYWENLGNIYKNLRGAADGAERWSLNSYTQAISLNPLNPRLRIELGGIYYTNENYQQAISTFQDAIRLKPDHANAYYNLSWALRKNGQIRQALASMERALAYVDKDSEDFTKAQEELEELRSLAADLPPQQQGPLDPNVLGEQNQQPQVPSDAEGTPSAEPQPQEEEASPSAEAEGETEAEAESEGEEAESDEELDLELGEEEEGEFNF